MTLLRSARGDAPAGGGVLSDGAICEEVARGRLIVGNTFRRSSLQPASYDVTAACDGLIEPGGEEAAPGARAASERVALEPGDAAMFSTRELFCMPTEIAGNITIKNRLATEGLLLLSGGLIDPGYGQVGGARRQSGCRLYLHVANIGRKPIVITTGSEPIARVQFLRVCGAKLRREPIKPSLWDEQRRPSLGFLSDLKELNDRVRRASYRSEQVVLFGFIVLAATLIGVSLSTVLSISQSTSLVRDLHELEPRSAGGAVLLTVALASIALNGWALGRWLFRRYR